jgi:hypothetical protein
MLQWVSRLLKPGPCEPSVLAPDEIPHEEVEVTARGRDGTLSDVTVLMTRKRLLLTNKAHTKEELSIPLVNMMALESTRTGIRVAYRDAEGDEQELWLGHVSEAGGDDLVGMGDDSWVQAVAARILEETGRDVWKEGETPWYVRGA